MAAKKGGTYVRVKDNTLRAINKVAGELQRETGENQSADTALRYLIEKLFPDIAQEEMLSQNTSSVDDKVGKENGN